MKQIYIDKNFRCYIENKSGRTKIETTAFDGKCDHYIEGYRYIPAGETWTREDGVVFYGEMICPAVNYNELDNAQREDEQSALSVLGAINTESPAAEADKIRLSMDFASAKLSDEEAWDNQALFPMWNSDWHTYTSGDKFRWNNLFWKVLQGHISQPDWTPDTAHGLYVAITDPSEEWPLIPNPIPAENPWMNDQKGRTADGQRWISKMDNNVWQPEDYPQGWVPAEQE